MLRPYDLTFLVWREVLLITSLDAALDGNYHTVKVYPVSDLLRKTADGSFDCALLANAITGTIEPDSWRDAGGTGTLKVIAGTLIIAQPDSTHAQIEKLLCILRRVGNPALSPRTEIESQSKAKDGGQRRKSGGGLGRNLGLG